VGWRACSDTAVRGAAATVGRRTWVGACSNARRERAAAALGAAAGARGTARAAAAI